MLFPHSAFLAAFMAGPPFPFPRPSSSFGSVLPKPPPLHAAPTPPLVVRLQPQVPMQTICHAILPPSRLRGRRTGMVTAWPVVPEDHPEVLDLLAIGQHQRAWKRSSDRLRRLVRDDRLRKATTAAAEERRRRLTQTGLPTFFPAPGGEK